MYCYLNRVDCKYADMNGWCDSTVCHNMNLLANCHNLEVGTVPTQENKPQSHWHTGTPTEEGWYVVSHIDPKASYPYGVAQWSKECGWCGFGASNILPHNIKKWQKIEEASNGDGN